MLLLVAADAAHATPKSYPLYCRGGGTIYTNNFIQMQPMKDPTNYWGPSGIYSDIQIGIQHTTNSYHSLQPGQCAWKDRPLGSTEPVIVHYREGNAPLTTMYSVPVSDGSHRFAIQVQNANNNGWWLPPPTLASNSLWAWPNETDGSNIDDGTFHMYGDLFSPNFYIEYMAYGQSPYLEVTGIVCTAAPTNSCWN